MPSLRRERAIRNRWKRHFHDEIVGNPSCAGIGMRKHVAFGPVRQNEAAVELAGNAVRIGQFIERQHDLCGCDRGRIGDFMSLPQAKPCTARKLQQRCPPRKAGQNKWGHDDIARMKAHTGDTVAVDGELGHPRVHAQFDSCCFACFDEGHGQCSRSAGRESDRPLQAAHLLRRSPDQEKRRAGFERR